jgi:RNA polymerase sigma-70 factor (ECF subfamily)
MDRRRPRELASITPERNSRHAETQSDRLAPVFPGVNRPVPESHPDTLADADLVSRCRRGDDGAWAELVERFSRYVYAIVVRGFHLAGPDAEDVFQDVFARTYERLATLRDDAAIRPFIGQLTRRLAVDRLRQAARTPPNAELGDGPAAEEDVFARLDDALAVREALAELPDDSREVLERFFARDESYRTIGEALNLPAGTVASRISRGLAKLRVELEGRNGARRPSR